MNAVFEAIGKFLSSWKPWVVVSPWERGVRIRFGRTATQLDPGIHLRIPVLDRVVLVNTRLRTTTTAASTLPTSAANRVRVVSAVVGYVISEPLKALLVYNNPQQSVCAFVQAEVARGLSCDDCLAAVRCRVENTGLSVEFLSYIENVEVRAYRLLQTTWSVDASDQGHGNESVVRY